MTPWQTFLILLIPLLVIWAVFGIRTIRRDPTKFVERLRRRHRRWYWRYFDRMVERLLHF